MKQLFLFSIIVLLMMNLIGCGGQETQSMWLNHTLSIDGDSKDWKDIPLTYNEDLKLIYGIANNDTTLSFLIRFNDQRRARSLARRGLTLWFNENNEKEKLLGIHFIDEFAREQRSGRGADRGNMERADNAEIGRQKNVQPQGTFTLAQRDIKGDGPLITDINGFEAAAAYAEGLYSYEFSISINNPDKTAHSLKLTEERALQACLVMEPMSEGDKDKMQAMKGRREGNGGGQGGGIGGGRGGGMGGGRGGRPGRGGGSQAQMPDTDGDEIWITVILAGNNISK